MANESPLDDALKGLVNEMTNTIQIVGNNSLENDKALLRLAEITTERLINIEMRVQHLEAKVDMLHELYHTHFADTVEETRH